MIRALIAIIVASVLGLPSVALADSVTAGVGIPSIPLGAGLGNSATTFNPGTGGSQQSIVSGGALFLQLGSAAKTGNYTLNADFGGISDTARILKANGTGSIQFTAPNPAGTLAPYEMADQSNHGFTVNTTGGTATFYGCASGSPTTLIVPAGNAAQIFDDGTNYFCILSPLSGFPAATVTTGIAAAGTTQGTATSISSKSNYVATGANCTAYPNCSGKTGVIATAGLMVVGNDFYVINEDSANGLVFYPPAGATINLQSANAPIFIQANTTAHLLVKSATALRTDP